MDEDRGRRSKEKGRKRSIIGDRHDGRKCTIGRGAYKWPKYRTNSNITIHYCKGLSIML